MTPQLRISPEGVVAVRDTHLYGGIRAPWSVIWIPRGHHSHWHTQALTDQAVATWDVARAGTPAKDTTR